MSNINEYKQILMNINNRLKVLEHDPYYSYRYKIPSRICGECIHWTRTGSRSMSPIGDCDLYPENKMFAANSCGNWIPN